MIVSLFYRLPIVQLAIVALIALLLFRFIRKKLSRAGHATGYGKPNMPSAKQAVKGALFIQPGGDAAIGYFEDGAVYSSHWNKMGDYGLIKQGGPDNHFIVDGKTVGWYFPSDDKATHGQVFIYKEYRDGYPHNAEKVADIGASGDKKQLNYIHSNGFQGSPEYLYWSGDDMAGAAAAFVILVLQWEIP